MTSRGEFSFIDQLRRKAEAVGPISDLVIGIGDDAAVWDQRRGRHSVISADLLIEEIDFRLDWSGPADLGHKALAVSLSDVAAMGAAPRWALLSIGLPARIWRGEFLRNFYRGFSGLAATYGVTLIGGDISRTPDKAIVDSIVIGETMRRGGAVRRAGARVGDALCVTGSLGGAAAGLELLRAEGGPGGGSRRAEKELLRRQRRPQPRVAWGRLLGEERLASAMIDVSDGLSSDLLHLCRASGVGARVETSRLPLDPNLRRAGNFGDERQLSLALHGGEDFELLFTVPRRRVMRLPSLVDDVPVTQIGEVVPAGEGVKIGGGGKWKSLRAGGFAHFADRK